MKRKLVLGVVLAALAFAGGIAYAGATDHGTIAACAKTGSGALRLDTGSGCLPSEEPVQWTASHTQERYYRAANLGDPSTFLPLPVGFLGSVVPARIVSTQVAAGDYELSAQITAANRTGAGVVACLILDGSTTHGFGQTAVGIDAGYSFQQTMTISGAVSLDHDATLDLSCWSSPNAGHAQGSPGVLVADITTTSVDTASVTQDVH